MIINTNETASFATALIAQVGHRCEVAVRAHGYGIHVSGPLVYEDGVFSVTCTESEDRSNGCAVFEPQHVQTIHRSQRGTLLVALKS